MADKGWGPDGQLLYLKYREAASGMLATDVTILLTVM